MTQSPNTESKNWETTKRNNIIHYIYIGGAYLRIDINIYIFNTWYVQLQNTHSFQAYEWNLLTLTI